MISICLFVRYCWPCHCIVCPFRYTFSDYPFIIYINDIVLSVLLRYTESDCSFIIYIVFFVLLRYTDSDCSLIIYIVFFVLLRYTDSDCSFDIFKLWLYIWNKSYSVYVVHSFRLIWNGFVSFGFMVFNATFNTISVISCRSVLLVEETGGPGEKHRPVASHVSNNVAHLEIQTHNNMVNAYVAVNPTTIRPRSWRPRE